nr:hypothetical protein [Tanacetum cinerariifolium]
MDLRWQMAMLTIRARRFLKNTGSKFSLNGNENIRFDKSKVKCYNCPKKGHFVKECRAPRSQDTKHEESTIRTVPMETHASVDMVSCDGLSGYDWSDQPEDSPTNFALMAYSSISSNTEPIVTKPIVKKPVSETSEAKASEDKPKGNLQMDLQDKGVIDNGCSRHMTGNMSCLTDYEEIDRGYVAFGSNLKGGKITGRGKFDDKADEGFFVGYSLNSKAFRVFNDRTTIVEENFHIRFSENTPNIAGSRPNWLFDIDALTKSMNYKPLVVGNQSNDNAESKSSQDDGFQPSSDDGKKANLDTRKENEYKDQEKQDNMNNTNNVNDAGTNEVNKDDDEEADKNNVDTTIQVSLTPTTRIHKDHLLDQVIINLHSTNQTRNISKNLEEHRAIGTKWLFWNKKDERGIVIRNKVRLVAQGHIQEEGIDYDGVFTSVARIKAIRLFLAYASFKYFVVFQMDVKSAFLYEKIEEEVYVCQPLGFEDPDFLDKVYKVEALSRLYQAPRAWRTYILPRIAKVKNASTPIETQKPLLKDEDGKEVDVHMYRSMISSLMYLTSSKPDIMFVVYLKGQPKFVLWYSKHSPFDLVAYTDSDYAGASLDRKSATGGCQFLGCRLISWQCKKQNVVANSTTEAEYVAASSITYFYWVDVNADEVYTSCIEQFWATVKAKTINGEEQLQALVDGKKEYEKVGKGFSGRDTPLFLPMMVQAQEDMGKGLANPTDPYHTSTIIQPSTSQPQKPKQHTKSRRKVTNVPQPSDPTSVADKAVNKEMDDSLERDATTATSLDAEQDKGNISKTQSKVTRNEPGSQGTSSGGGPREDSLKLTELMKLYTKLLQRVLDLETTKTTQVMEIKSLKRRVKKLERRKMSRTHGLKRFYNVRFLAQVESSEDEERAQQEVEANIALIESWDDVQAKINADYQLVERLQAEEQHELNDEEKDKLFMQLVEKKRKFFTAKRAEEKRSKPPTQAQQRKIMCTYLKNRKAKKLTYLKNKSFDSIQKMFDRAFKRIITFVDYRTELVEESSKKAREKVTEGSYKRAGTELEQKIAKKQNIDHDKETAKLKQEDVETLWKLLKTKYGSTRPEGDYERVLWGDLKVMFEPHIEDEVRKMQQRYKVLRWMLFNSCRVYCLTLQSGHIYMLVERRYPLTPVTITNMLNKKLHANNFNEMTYQLLKLVLKQLKNN